MVADRAPWLEVGLTAREYDLICEQLEREPNALELGMYGLMWSEHCAYKHSKVRLGDLPTEADWVVAGPGDNAGIIELPGGMLAFRLESHNHPSAVEPFQGAATGVGGILRDIYASGARPVALLNSLHFGPPSQRRQRYLLDGVVEGIAHYGNCVGVPTVGGEVDFSQAYAENPLVNVMCAGWLDAETPVRARAAGEGNLVVLAGSATGRDGLHGASLLASQTFNSTGGQDAGRNGQMDGEAGNGGARSAVQIGDPFQGKLLMEACLEAAQQPWLVGMTDLGAAGLTSAAAEMAASGDRGMQLQLERVPLRRDGLTPYEIMLSETQERMLLVVDRGARGELETLFSNWQVPVAVIGEITSKPIFSVYMEGETVAEVPVHSLVGGAPLYRPDLSGARGERQTLPKADRADRPVERTFDPQVTEPVDWERLIQEFVTAPELSDRAPVYRRFDHMVGVRTILEPGHDAAVIRLDQRQVSGEQQAAATPAQMVALSVDAGGRYASLDPYRGAVHCVCEAARNVACTGLRPRALTNGLNLGSPEDPGVYRDFDQLVEGISDACQALGIPVTGGNVSFYNQTEARAVWPTPVIGMVGTGELKPPVPSGWSQDDQRVYLLTTGDPVTLDASLFAQVSGDLCGRPPEVNLEKEQALIQLLVELAAGGRLTSAHDVSAGGLAPALIEAALTGPVVGARLSFPPALFAGDTTQAAARARLLFGEGAGRVIVTCSVQAESMVERKAKAAGIQAVALGETGGKALMVEGLVQIDLERIRKTWTAYEERKWEGAL